MDAKEKRRGVFANSTTNQFDLLAWLDKQERKPFSSVVPVNRTVKAFDPLNKRHKKASCRFPSVLLNSMAGVPPGNKVSLGKGKEPLNGGLLWVFQSLLCLIC